MNKMAKDGLMQRAGRVLLLTGTPMLNRPIEIQPLLAALAPEEFGNFMSFAKRYAGAHQKNIGRRLVWDFSGASRLEELQERMRATVMVRRLKKDVLKELPPKRRQVVVLPTNGAAKAVEAERVAWERHEQELADVRDQMDLAHAAGDEVSYEAAARQLAAATSIAFQEISRARHNVAVAKVPAVIEHVEGMMEEGVEKLILFAHHHDVVDALKAAFGDAAVVLTGQTAMEDRQAAVDRFQTDPSCKVFIGSITAAGVGLTLTAASVVVFAELDWVPANVSQAEDRAHRIGQTEHVLVQHLVLDGSLDARMAQVIVDKQEIADRALDNSTEVKVPVIPADSRRGARPSKYPVATPEQKAAAKAGLRQILALCDGVVQQDGMGFSAATRGVGASLAQLHNEFTDGQVFLAKKVITIHNRQVSDDVLEVLGITPGGKKAKAKK